MKINCYSVYDAVAKCYTAPFNMLNDDVAIRTMANCVNDPQHNYSLNPTDYTLFKVGEFDDNEGTYEPKHEQVTNLNNLAIRNDAGE